MPVYANAEQVYACIGTLFNRVLARSPDTAQAILASRTIFRLHCSAPSAEILLNGRQSPVQPSFGASAVRPDLDIHLAADTLHLILLNQLSIREALAGGQLKVRGPVWKTSAVVDLLTEGRALYPQVLREHGFTPQAQAMK